LSAMHGGLFGGFKPPRKFPLTHRVVFAPAPIVYIPRSPFTLFFTQNARILRFAND